jgi:hypothetical protein
MGLTDYLDTQRNLRAARIEAIQARADPSRRPDAAPGRIRPMKSKLIAAILALAAIAGGTVPA